MKRKSVLVLTVVVMIIALILTGCGGSKPADQPKVPEAGKKIVMRMGTGSAGLHQQNATMAEFKKQLEAKIGDKIEVQIYPASQLGTMAQMVQGTQDGSIQAVFCPSGYFAQIAPVVAIIDLPYFFKNSDQAYKILNAGTPLDSYMAGKGFVVASWLRGVDRVILSKKPIADMNDIKGMKLHCFPNPIAQEEIKAFGGVPTNIDTGDVSVALQQGTIDGTVSDVTFFNAMKFYVSAPNLTLAPHGAITNVFAISKVWLDGLSEDVRKAILETAKEVTVNFEYDYVEQFGKKSLETMVANGLKVVEPSAQFEADLQKASQAVHGKYISGGPEYQQMYNDIKAPIDKE